MKIYAHFNSDGFIIGFYDDEVFPDIVGEDEVARRNDAIPSSAVEVSAADHVNILGYPQYHRWTGEVLESLPVPALTRAIDPISDRQFFEQLALDGVITEDEALATSDGTLPQLLEQAIDALPQESRFRARMQARNATTYERNNPLVALIAQHLGWDSARLDKLWEDARQL